MAATNQLTLLLKLSGAAQVITGLNQLAEISTKIANLAAGPARAIASLINAADEVGKSAQKIGIGVEALSKLRHAAELAGVSNEGLETGIKHLNKTLSEAAGDSASAAAKALQAIGFSAVDAAGKVKAPDQALLELSDRFASFRDGANKSALAMQLFGRSGVDMIPLLNQGAAGIRESMSEVQGVSGVMAKLAEALNDNVTRLKAAFGDAGNVIVNELLPHLADLSAWLVKLQKDSLFFSTAAVFVIDVMKSFAFSVHSAWTSLTLLGNAIRTVARFISEAYFNAIRAAVELGEIWAGNLKDIAKLIVGISTGNISLLANSLGALGGDAKVSIDKIGAALKANFSQGKEAADVMVDDARKKLLTLASFFTGLFTPRNIPAPQEADLTKPEAPAFGSGASKDDAGIATEEELLKARSDSLLKVSELNKQFQLAQLDGVAKLRTEEDLAHQKRLDQINQLLVTNAEKQRLVEQAARVHQLNLTKIEQKALEQRRELNSQNLSNIGSMFGSLASLAQAFGKKGFAAAKAFSYAQAVINVAEGATKALAQGGYAGIFLMAAVLAAGAAQIATISATKPSIGGAAHGGLDFVPAEQTFLLQRGERVIQPSANVELTEFLERQNGGGDSISGMRPIHTSVYVDGRELFKLIHEATSDGRLTVKGRAVIA